MENMNKVDAPCRPAASLKFTIDNILNLKTSGRNCDNCHPAGAHDDSTTPLRKDAFQSHHEEQRQDPGSRLNESGKWGLMCLLTAYTELLSCVCIITHDSHPMMLQFHVSVAAELKHNHSGFNEVSFCSQS